MFQKLQQSMQNDPLNLLQSAIGRGATLKRNKSLESLESDISKQSQKSKIEEEE